MQNYLALKQLPSKLFLFFFFWLSIIVIDLFVMILSLETWVPKSFLYGGVWCRDVDDLVGVWPIRKTPMGISSIRYSSIVDRRFSSLLLSFLVVVADSCFCASARMSFQILKWCSRHFCYLLSNLFSVTIINLSISFLMWFHITKLSYT